MRAQEAVALIERSRSLVFSRFQDFINTRTAMLNAEAEAGIEPEDRETDWVEAIRLRLLIIPVSAAWQWYETLKTINFDLEWGPKLKAKIDAFDRAVAEAVTDRARIVTIEAASQSTAEEVNSRIADMNRLIETAQGVVNEFKTTPYVRYAVEHDRSYTRLISLVFERVTPIEIRDVVSDIHGVGVTIVDAASNIARLAADRVRDQLETPWWVYGAYSLAALGLAAFIIVKVK